MLFPTQQCPFCLGNCVSARGFSRVDALTEEAARRELRPAGVSPSQPSRGSWAHSGHASGPYRSVCFLWGFGRQIRFKGGVQLLGPWAQCLDFLATALGQRVGDSRGVVHGLGEARPPSLAPEPVAGSAGVRWE